MPVAASLRGWVTPMRPVFPDPASKTIFGSCVVFPEHLIRLNQIADIVAPAGDRQHVRVVQRQFLCRALLCALQRCIMRRLQLLNNLIGWLALAYMLSHPPHQRI
jgi:hypothetical protein